MSEAMRMGAHPGDDGSSRGPHLLDRLAALLFGIEALTGVLLACYYRPTPETAYESTRTIVRDVSLGWFIHGLHAWGAKLLVGVVVLRLLHFFWDGLYRAPRAILWWSAVGMVWLVLQSDFTGRLLPWDSHSYWAATRGLEVVFALPVLGPALSFLLGGRAVDENVLIRFYVLHVMVLSAGFGLLLALSFATQRRLGSSAETAPPASVASTSGDHLYTTAILSLLMFGVLATLTVLVPLRLRDVADPYSTPAGVGPPWYMLAPYAVIERGPGPKVLMGLVLLAAALAVLLLPQWTQRLGRAVSHRHMRWWLVLGLAAWVALSVAGARLEQR